MDKEQSFHANKLHQCNQILSTIKSKDNLEKAAVICKEKLQQLNFKEVNQLVLESLINSILGKVLILFQNDDLTPQTANLVNYMEEKEIISPFYKNLLAERKEKKKESVEETTLLKPAADSFNANLDVLLSLDATTDRYVKKSFGYSFLDLNGDFIWCDAISEQFFEMKSKETANKNFFDLMIPYSSNLLHARYGEELFQASPHIGSSLSFSYVIYSKQATNKFLKQLKKKGITNMDNMFSSSVERKKKTLYHRHMKTLSSRATLIVLKFTTGEFRDIVNSKKHDVNISDSINQLLDNMGETLESRFKGVGGLNERIGEGGNSGQYIIPKVIKRGAEQDCKDLYKMAIMVETRIAKNIPDFDFEKMAEDKKIKEFEVFVKTKLKNN